MVAPAPPLTPVTKTAKRQTNWKAIVRAVGAMKADNALARPLTIYKPPPCVLPAAPDGEYLAMDSNAEMGAMLTLANQMGCVGGFPGYPYLAQLLQRTEYYEAAATLASEMTRKWVRLVGAGDGKHDEKITAIQRAFEQFNVRGLFRDIVQLSYSFGRCQLFIDVEGQEARQADPLLYQKETFKAGMLRGLKVIEPIWTTPHAYNSVDATAADFYKPKSWYVIGKRVHASRLLTFIPKPVSDILKPAYNFGGLSLPQLMEPYVNQWLRTRDSVSDLVYNFSILVLKTNLQSTLEGEETAGQLAERVRLFIQHRSNRGLMLADMESEELEQLAVPLSGLSDLQAQAQEHLAGPTHIPLVKLWGVTPAGLNANSDGEIRVFYDYIAAEFEAHFKPHLKTVLDLIQLHLFGDVDPDIYCELEPLHAPDAVEEATIRKTDAERDGVLIDKGVIDADESRARIRNARDSDYDNLEGEAPGPPDLGEGLEDGAAPFGGEGGKGAKAEA